VVDGVESFHPRSRIADGAGNDEAGVDCDQADGEGLETLERSVLDVRRFDLEIGNAGGGQEWQQEQAVRDDPEAHHEVQQRVPQDQPRRGIVEPAYHRRAGGGGAGDGFEEGIRHAHFQGQLAFCRALAADRNSSTSCSGRCSMPMNLLETVVVRLIFSSLV
jgi:hypothetical protein